MRTPNSLLKLLLAALALVLTLGTARPSFADDRADARTHYQAGQKAYAAADYKAAIKEFGAAQQLVPADLNSYNLALCYDKLGDAEPAMQYYREYLNKVPNTDKRAEIEASVARLDAAAKSAATKRADEDRRADEAKRAEDAKHADEAKRLEDQRRADEARRAPPPLPAPVPSAPTGGVPPAMGVGPSIGATVGPATGPTPTGDPQLDRVQAIDINQIRNQRGGASLDMRGGGPAVAANGPAGAAPAGAPGPSGPTGPAAPLSNPAAPAAEHESPVYKKWWFWAVVGVSLYVVYEIATENSSSNSTAREMPLARMGNAKGVTAAQPPQGLTLLRW